ARRPRHRQPRADGSRRERTLARLRRTAEEGRSTRGRCGRRGRTGRAGTPDQTAQEAMSSTFADLPELAQHLRAQLDTKKFVLLYAYNGTGKTRLSTAFKNIGKTVDANGEVTARDTLYFNAFTEDLFQWDNDLANDSRRVLKINSDSRFFAGLAELEMDNRIRPLLNRYADFDF